MTISPFQNRLLAIAVCVSWLTPLFAMKPPQEGRLRITVVEGNEAVNVVSQRTAVAPVVEIRDRNDAPVAAAAVVFRITTGNATFWRGAQQVTVLTDAAGRAVGGGFVPTKRGRVDIDVRASVNGETLSTSITQENVGTIRESAARLPAQSNRGQAPLDQENVGTIQENSAKLSRESNSSQQPSEDNRYKIAVVAGEDAVNVISQKTAVAPVVEIRDRNDLPVAGVPVVFRIATANATFVRGAEQITVLTDAAGRATTNGFVAVRNGPVTIDVNASVGGQNLSASIRQSNIANVGDTPRFSNSSTSPTQGGGSGGGGIGAKSILGILAGGAAVATGAVLVTQAGGSGGVSSPTVASAPPVSTPPAVTVPPTTPNSPPVTAPTTATTVGGTYSCSGNFRGNGGCLGFATGQLVANQATTVGASGFAVNATFNISLSQSASTTAACLSSVTNRSGTLTGSGYFQQAGNQGGTLNLAGQFLGALNGLVVGNPATSISWQEFNFSISGSRDTDTVTALWSCRRQ